MGQIKPSGDLQYAVEKFSHAVYALAVDPGPIKDRLFSAFLEFCPVSERDIPPELLSDFCWIRNELTKREASKTALVEGRVVVRVEGRVGATLRTMRTQKAVAIARRICELAQKLEDKSVRP